MEELPFGPLCVRLACLWRSDAYTRITVHNHREERPNTMGTILIMEAKLLRHSLSLDFCAASLFVESFNGL